MKNRKTVVILQTAGLVFWKPSPQFVFRIAWHLQTNVKCSGEVYFKPSAMFEIAWDLEELNQRIRENGLTFRLPCIYFFDNICQLPALHKTECTSFSSWISHIYKFSNSDHFFRHPWVPVTFFSAAMLAVYHFPIKICKKNIVLTQHSPN